jgi:transcriptional regulator with XRE-family HTH domain
MGTKQNTTKAGRYEANDYPQVDQILERLIEARVGAGLSKTQAAKLLGFSSNVALHALETNANQVDLPTFLKMCEIYDASPTWILTGENPNFDEQAFDELTQFSGAGIEDIANLKDTMKRLRHGKDES